jgi:hypothetical protein
MSLTLPQLLQALGAAQGAEVAPALALAGDAAAYAAGTAATSAALIMVAAADASTLAPREAAAAAAARPLIGEAADGRDARHEALGERLAAAEAAGDGAAQRQLLDLLLAEATADYAALGLPLPE